MRLRGPREAERDVAYDGKLRPPLPSGLVCPPHDGNGAFH